MWVKSCCSVKEAEWGHASRTLNSSLRNVSLVFRSEDRPETPEKLRNNNSCKEITHQYQARNPETREMVLNFGNSLELSGNLFFFFKNRFNLK